MKNVSRQPSKATMPIDNHREGAADQGHRHVPEVLHQPQEQVPGATGT